MRTVFRLNSSKAITLPPEWPVKVGDKLAVMFDGVLVLIPLQYTREIDKVFAATISDMVAKADHLEKSEEPASHDGLSG